MKTQRRPQQAASPDSDAYRDLLDVLTAAIAPLQTLHQQAVEIHAPTVREILHNGSRDARLIEQTLDHLLDHACIPQGLAVFKSLCRYYWEFNPQATASYINAYREMWDSDDPETKEAELAGDLPNRPTVKPRAAKPPHPLQPPKGRSIPAQGIALGQPTTPQSPALKGRHIFPANEQ
ncbi:MAG: hypothetical protein K9N23_18270 [Akkermansiaceae bacterium]|nr:hypothetical protein [Akkermansiaceae bacterium]MCF7733641.1 hypothetical protein [Akkermansiaceae bacterium]